MDGLNLIQSMSVEEKRALRDRLDYELTKRRVEFGTNEKLVWEGLCVVLKQKTYLSVDQLAAKTGREKYRTYVANIMDFLSYATGGITMSRNVKAEMIVLVLECMKLWFRRIENGTLTEIGLLRNTNKIYGIVDLQFPGYADARMLHRIVPNKKAA